MQGGAMSATRAIGSRVPQGEESTVNRFFQILASFGAPRLIAMATVVIGLIGFFFFVTMRLSQPDMSLLYGDLDIAESGRIVERLETMKIPYRLADGGRTIFAPADRVNQLRVTLAGEGLGGNIIGYEIFDRSEGLGTTSFVQRINRLRAIEGELARTIQEIKAVKSARVHIVMPERELFSRQAREPSASIVLRAATPLTREQIAAIEHLVAAAVPGLSPSKISIVDQNGTLLARSRDEGADALASSLDDKRRGLEEYYRRRVEQLLEKAVGVGHVRAQVAVQLDLNTVTTNEESYDPDSTVVRSTRTTEEISSEQKAGEAPVGVDSNLPGGQQAGAGGGPLARTQKTEEVTNYEVSKTVRTSVRERGEIARISAAVLVDQKYRTDDNGEQVAEPRSEQELEELAALVRSAIGYDANRGDTVEIASMPFQLPEEITVPIEEPFRLFGLDKSDLYRMLEMLVFGVVSIFVILLVVRPLINRLIQAIPEAAPAGAQLAGPEGHPALAAPDAQMDLLPGEPGTAAALSGSVEQAVATTGEGGMVQAAGAVGGNINANEVEGDLKESVVRKIGEIVGKHPDEAATIIRSWLYEEE
ncbi:MAG: flagellar M-ring protein FliF [Alphaproteobacteria bacterium]|nr:MAG: flagellar M-ring protein FliF [Alphaproteobacteria bacterium]